MIFRSELASRAADGEWGARGGAQGRVGTASPLLSVSPSQPQTCAWGLQLLACGFDKLSSACCTGFAKSCDHIRNSIPLEPDGLDMSKQGHGKRCNSLLIHGGSSFPTCF